MTKFKIAAAAILALLLVIVILQNTESVETKFLFVTVSMPRAALLFVHMVVGFIVGLLTAYSINRKKTGT